MPKMDIFISWSGPRSHAVAKTLKKYLPMIVNDLNPWLSSDDLGKGTRTMEGIADALTNARAGIICLTPGNLREPWILFEAGAIAKQIRQKTLACTLLIGVDFDKLRGPLFQFQGTKTEHDDMLRLVLDLNKALVESALNEEQVKESFETFWPAINAALEQLPDEGEKTEPEIKPEDILKELWKISQRTSLSVLESHREIMQQLGKLESAVDPKAAGNRLVITSGGQVLNWAAAAPERHFLSLFREGDPVNSGGTTFETPFVPGGTSETLAAKTNPQNSGIASFKPHQQKHSSSRSKKARPNKTGGNKDRKK